jgi:hypothetical protein
VSSKKLPLIVVYPFATMFDGFDHGAGVFVRQSAHVIEKGANSVGPGAFTERADKFQDAVFRVGTEPA